MLSDVADRVFKELMEAGYDPKLHEPKGRGRPFEITLRGHEFDIDDFSSTATSSSSLLTQVPTPRSPGCAPTWTAARLAARSTRACAP